MLIAKSAALVTNALGRISEKLLPRKAAPYLLVDGDRFSDRLVYETEFEDDGRKLILLSDDAVGTMWEIDALPHEILTEKELQERMEDFSQLFRMIVSRRLTFQVIFDQRLSDEFPLPKWDERQTFARKAMKKRIAAIKRLAKDSGDRPALVERRYYLTLRVERLPMKLEAQPTLAAQLEAQAENLREAVIRLRDFARSFENMYIARFGEHLKRCGAEATVGLLRSTLHGEAEKRGLFHAPKPDFNRREPIKKQVLNGSISWDRECVGVGADSWEMISWGAQPGSVYPGMMTRLLRIKGTVRCVINIRPAHYTDDLEPLSNKVKGGDPYQERQRRQVLSAEDRVVGGEVMLHCSMHVLYRNVGVPASAPRDLRQGEALARELSDTIPMFLEDYAAMPVFMVALPFMSSPKTDPFIARDKRVLSDDIGAILPIFGGTVGARIPCQLMQARSGEAIWINPRAGRTNPHLAIYGGSQSGKSFDVADLIYSEFAADPDVMMFLLDSICSYTYGARALGEDHGMKWHAPPASYPNLFRGEIKGDRLGKIVGIVNVAVAEICNTVLDGPEQTILGDAILETYQDNLNASRLSYMPSDDPGKPGSYGSGSGRMRVPHMGAIVNKLTIVAEKKDAPESVVRKLREKLLPFHGTGPYAMIFDQAAEEMPDERAPGITIYELAALSKSVRVLATMIIIDEIERLIEYPVNQERPGMILIEEAGVNLGGENPLLETWVKDAWLRFAKKGISCVMVTNNTEHYLKLPACAAAWNTSASKKIFPIASSTEADHLARMLPDPYYAEIAKSLMKVPGAFSEFLWLGDSVKGTGTFVPTGYDYWMAANHKGDTKVLDFAFETHGSWQLAIHCLAEIAPMGFRDETANLRAMTETEKNRIREYKYVEDEF